jgi:hypothetical protein
MSGLGMILQEFGDEKPARSRRALAVHPRLKNIPDLVKLKREG